MIEGKEPGEKYTTGDFTVDEKHRTVALTEEGVLKVEKLLGHRAISTTRQHRDEPPRAAGAARPHALSTRPRLRGEGRQGHHRRRVHRTPDAGPPLERRPAPGVEAKEGVKIQRENQTLATITFQNYFRMYKKLAGMTGTAETEAAEFDKIYKLDVTVDPDQPSR